MFVVSSFIHGSIVSIRSSVIRFVCCCFVALCLVSCCLAVIRYCLESQIVSIVIDAVAVVASMVCVRVTVSVIVLICNRTLVDEMVSA